MAHIRGIWMLAMAHGSQSVFCIISLESKFYFIGASDVRARPTYKHILCYFDSGRLRLSIVGADCDVLQWIHDLPHWHHARGRDYLCKSFNWVIFYVCCCGLIFLGLRSVNVCWNRIFFFLIFDNYVFDEVRIYSAALVVICVNLTFD